MALGFRKSLFGFNCNDVIDYIENTHRKFKIKADNLKHTTDELSAKLDQSKIDYQNLLNEKNDIAEKLEEFAKKADEIERLSESIGKLYLVSQANAQAVMSNSQESAELSKDEVLKNLSAIDQAHVSLNVLRESIIKTSEDYINEVDSLIASLDNTRRQIADNTQKTDEAIENFEQVYENIVNE